MKRDTLMAFRLPAEIREAIRRAAANEQRSGSNLVLRVVTEWLEERGYIPKRTKK